MFTGIIEEIGQIETISSNRITVKSSLVLEDTKIGDSIAVNGVCLTVVNKNKNSFTADISNETFSVTAFKYLKNNDLVNLERALPANGRFGGHIVSGHTDGTGKVISFTKDNNFYNLKIELNENNSKYMVQKGSVCVNGISLTIAHITNNQIEIAVIPHSFENTNLKAIKSGDYVNIETDIISKYIEKFLSTSDNKTEIDMKFLVKNGF